MTKESTVPAASSCTISTRSHDVLDGAPVIARGELGCHQAGRLKRVSDGQYLAFPSPVKQG